MPSEQRRSERSEAIRLEGRRLQVRFAELKGGLERISGIWEHGEDAEAAVREAMDIAHDLLDEAY
jgi:hypothetical protein